jgi:hypothetical protein
LGDVSDTKIAQQDIVAPSEQHVLRFDIAVDEFFVVRMLQAFCYLSDIRHNGVQGKLSASRVALAQGAIGRKVQNEEGSIALHTEVHHTHNVRMHQAGDGACLLEKGLEFVIRYFGLQDLNSDLCIEVHVLTKIDIREASTPNESDEAVAAELLSYMVCHP